MLRLAADLHIHTVLSPCASRAMTPAAIVREAAARGVEVIAVCDHNTAGNVTAVAAAAARMDRGPFVIAGIEITTSEEVHVLGYFPSAESAVEAGRAVTERLPLWRPLTSRTASVSRGPREPDQQIVDAEGNVTGIEERMLAAASPYSLSETVDLIHSCGGLAIAAHMDRRSFSVPGQLGFLPPDVPFDGLEISAAGVSRGCEREFACHGITLISSSDSHFPTEIGTGITALDVESMSFDELALALRGSCGRGCAIA